jgi:flagellum-specific peptidoglycan hydrolase FlgJ
MNKYQRLLIAVLLFLSSNLNAQKSDYTKKYKPLADSLSAIYLIPSSVILGIAIVESGYGTSKMCRVLNTHFGMKGKNSFRKKMKSAYRQYDSDTASYIAFCKMVAKRKYYTKMTSSQDIRSWLMAIGRAGYNNHPTSWTNAIMRILKKEALI